MLFKIQLTLPGIRFRFQELRVLLIELDPVEGFPSFLSEPEHTQKICEVLIETLRKVEVSV